VTISGKTTSPPKQTLKQRNLCGYLISRSWYQRRRTAAFWAVPKRSSTLILKMYNWASAWLVHTSEYSHSVYTDTIIAAPGLREHLLNQDCRLDDTTWRLLAFLAENYLIEAQPKTVLCLGPSMSGGKFSGRFL
jgi:hypothetical protein